MYKTNEVISTTKPESLEKIGVNAWYYNYNITELEETFIDFSGEEQTKTRYHYIQVRIEGTPTFSNCFEAVLKEHIDENGTNLYSTLLTQGTNDDIDFIRDEIKADFNLVPKRTALEKAKLKLINKINEYDTSDTINSFLINGESAWFDKSTRVGLVNSITIEKNAGKETTTLWINGKGISVKCDEALQILNHLELYALNCYNITSRHKEIVNSLTSVEQVEAYDYTIGYPDKVTITYKLV